jgi:porin
MRLPFLLLALASTTAHAQGLTGDWGGKRTNLAESGVSIRADVTGFANDQLSGSGDNSLDSFGRYDVFADFDFGKMGSAEGWGFHMHLEGRFGNGQTNYGGELLPSFTGAGLPLGGEDITASSLYFTKTIGKRSVLIFGKINAVDLLATDPVLGGWGTQRFQHIAFVAPPSGVVPPTMMGAVFVHKSSPVSWTFMVFDPVDRTRDYFPDDLFKTGVNVSVGGTWSGNLAGRASSVGLTAAYSTARGTDFADILAPPGLVTDDKKGSYNVALQLTHRFMQSAEVKNKGLDFVLKAATADGNPNLIQSSVIVGLAGHGMVQGRPNDSFGIGAFAYNFSDVLQDTVNLLVDFNDEQGLEIWYSLALKPWLKITADAQYVNPANGGADKVLVGGVRMNLAF